MRPNGKFLLLLLEAVFGLPFLGEVFAILSLAGDANGGEMVFKYLGGLDVIGIARVGGFITLNLLVALYFVIRPFIDISGLIRQRKRLVVIILLLLILGACATHGTRAAVSSIIGIVLPTPTFTPTPTIATVTQPSITPRNLEILGTCQIHNVKPPCQIKPSDLPNGETVFKFVVALFPNETNDIQYDYAGRINFFVRDLDGTRGAFRDDQYYTIPDLNEKVDLEYAEYYLRYTECKFNRNNLFDTPCLYVANRTTASTAEAETYATISNYFYGNELYADCVEDANRTIYLPIPDNFDSTNIINGAIIVIPDKAGCDG